MAATTMDMSTHDHSDGSDSGHSGHMMQMYFYASAHCTILFEGWHTMTGGELFGSCLAVLVMAALYEGFKVLRQDLLENTRSKSTSQVQKQGSQGMIVEEPTSAPPPSMTRMLMSYPHILQSLLHFLQLFFSYCLMLVFMTYNIYVCLFLCIGGALGYWLFAWKSAVVMDKNEHCN